MGFSEPKELHLQLTQAMSKYPFILALHEADHEASTLLEGEKDNKALTKEQADAGGLKVITVWQPWAQLLAEGKKHDETRNWRT